MKVDHVPAVLEVESETKPQNKYINKMVSDYDKCQGDNRTG